MFYTYNRKNLELKRFGFKHYSIAALVLFLTYTAGRFIQVNHLTLYEKEFIIYMDRNYFSQDALIQALKDKHLKFPHIVLAQATLETGGFKSKVFKQNHNLFGMKQANIRINTAKGTNLNHAYYDNWQESVYDYAFYQCRYMGAANTEEEYFLALGASYAEAGNYVQALKTVIAKEKLKELF